ncbi:MAG: hypothetical protein HKO71_02740 [Pseudomonadales bacterium]|nr:hypothetical protein [Pseudomonadales bacterium]
MISLCPACRTEQMVTAIALQKNRGVVPCEHCAQAFKPRAHRVTPARERAFKQRQAALAEQSRPAVTPLQTDQPAIAPVSANCADSNDAALSTGRDTAGAAAQDEKLESATQRLIDELGKSVTQLNQQIVARVEQATNQLLQSKSLQKTTSENAEPHSKTATMTPDHETPAPLAQTISSPSMQEVNIDSPLAKNTNEAVAAPAKREEVAMADSTESNSKLSSTAMQQQRLRRMRQAVAREKMLLDYEKLKIENEKLEMEKKKLELERVKLEIMRKHNMLESKRVDPFASKGPALDGRPTVELVKRPVVEYDSKNDIFPRTPSAIDHGKPASEKREKVRLELLPNEPQRLCRKNLAVKNRIVKSK